MRDYPIYPEERDGKGGKAPICSQEPIEDERQPQFPTEMGGVGEGDEDGCHPTFEPDMGGGGGHD